MKAGAAGPALEIAPMRASDLAEVRRLELAALPCPWPESAMRHEVEQNPYATYFTARHAGRLLGYAGLWVQVDEMHVSMIAVLPEARRRGIAETLLVRLLREGMARGCLRATLEVRERNLAAQALYARYGFAEVGRRKRYYRDTDEDGLILTTPDFDDEAWRPRFEAQAAEALRRTGSSAAE